MHFNKSLRQPDISTQQLYRNRTKNNSNQKQILESSTWDLSYGTPFQVKLSLRRSVSLRIKSECGKIRTRKNSVFGHFSRSASMINCHFGTRHGIIMLTLGFFLAYYVKIIKISLMKKPYRQPYPATTVIPYLPYIYMFFFFFLTFSCISVLDQCIIRLVHYLDR